MVGDGADAGVGALLAVPGPAPGQAWVRTMSITMTRPSR